MANPTSNNHSKQTLLWVFLIPIIVTTGFFGIRLHEIAAERTKLKEYYGQVNSFTYGLLSIDTWKANIQKIATDRVMDFKLTEDQKKVLAAETTKVLNGLLIEAEKVTKKPNNGLGKIKTHFAKSYIKAARENVSKFAGTINSQLQDPATMDKLKKMVLDQFNQFAAATHSSVEDTENLKRLLAENNAESVAQFNEIANQRLNTLDDKSRKYTGILIAITALFLLAWWFVLKHKELQHSFFMVSLVFAFILLVTSLSIPMMEIDARLKSVDLVLIGEHIQFNEQVIYYRSKSLLQVVKVLIASDKVDSIGVGILILSFSILFPMAKLMAAGLYLRGSDRIKKSKLINFFAFKSGKWSMADVTVVAIFMAYIGFESIVNHNLTKLNVRTNMVESITTDASSMQAGFVLFTLFVIYSMVLSEVLKRILAQNKEKGLSPVIQEKFIPAPKDSPLVV